jgi:hypothetical protein
MYSRWSLQPGGTLTVEEGRHMVRQLNDDERARRRDVEEAGRKELENVGRCRC